MILLLGGTSDTAGVASRLAEAGYQVLVSMATDEPMDLGNHQSVSRRNGRLDAAAMGRLVRAQAVRAIVDVTHPYAATVRQTAASVAEEAGVGYFSFVRPGSESGGEGVCWAADHQEAARRAASFGRTILLTTGSNNLSCYVREADRAGVAVVARVLPREESLRACAEAGIPADRVIAEKGPFTVERNLAHIDRFHIGVLVSKDSGLAGGVGEKLEAARLRRCRVVMVRRPALTAGNTFASVDDLVAGVCRLVLP